MFGSEKDLTKTKAKLDKQHQDLLKTVSEANKVPSVLTPNKSASVLTQPSAKALPEVPKVEGFKKEVVNK